MKSRKWSARYRTAQDKICRVWEERGAEYARLQQRFEEAEEARQKKARERREAEAAQVKRSFYCSRYLLRASYSLRG